MHHLKLLASAVAGRAIMVAEGPAGRAWSDGETIFVSGERQRDTVVVQAALIAAGSLDPRLLAKTMGRRGLRSRYLTLEALRATQRLGDVVPRSVQRRVAELYGASPPQSSQESYERAASREPVPEAPEWLGALRPSKVALNTASAGSSRAAEDELAQAAEQPWLQEPDDEEESERSRFLELFSSPLNSGTISETVQRFLGLSRSPDPEGGSGEEMQARGARIARVGTHGQQAAAPVGFHLGQFLPAAGRAYPEWDCHKGRYKPDHCFVSEFDPRIEDERATLDDGNDVRLRRALAPLGLAQERHRRQAQGDALDLTALTDYAVDRTRGGSVDERVYELKRRTAHDLGVVVLLDCTGSTTEADSSSQVFDDQRQIALKLIATLDELGDRVAGYAFQSWGREGVRFLRIKGFDDRWDVAAQRRAAALQPGGFTRLGAAVRHATHLVTNKSGCINTLLVVVGDGLPYDDGYEQRYAQEDSAKALSEAVDAGVGCACLSVQTSTELEVLHRVWGHVPYVVIDRVGDLHREVMPVFRRGLREAARLGTDGRR